MATPTTPEGIKAMSKAAAEALGRGSGRTSAQMAAAAKGALFISCNGHCARTYDRHLAQHLGREDLVIRAPDTVLDLGGRSLLGNRWPEVVVDHALADVEPRWRQVMDTLHALFRPLRTPVSGP